MGFQKAQGFSLVEIILAVALFGLIVTALGGALAYGEESMAVGGSVGRAGYLAEEGLEAVRNIRDNSFAALVDGTYGLATTSNKWNLVLNTPDVTDNYFTRSVQIVTVDDKTKSITATVNWNATLQRTKSIVLTTYLTKWQASGFGNWALPVQDSIFNLTVANSTNDTANPTAIFFANNKIYLGRTNSAGKEFFIFDVSTPSAPVLLGQRDLNGTPMNIVVNGNYAYIASTDNASELQILDISTPSTIANAGKLTSVDLTNANSNDNNGDLLELATDGTYLYAVRNAGDEFLIFNISLNPASPGSPIGRSGNFVGIASDIALSGNYAYVISDDNSAELQVMNITNKALPTRIFTVDMNSGANNTNPLSAVVAGTNLFIGRQFSAAPEIYTYNISNQTVVPALSATLETGFSVLDMYFSSSNNYLFTVTSDLTNDFKVYNAAIPAALSLFGQLNIADSPVFLTYDFTLDRAFVADTADTSELIILKPS